MALTLLSLIILITLIHMKKILLSLTVGTLVAGCAAKTLETPEGIYTWQRGTLRWVPGKWVQKSVGVVPPAPTSDASVAAGGKAEGTF